MAKARVLLVGTSPNTQGILELIKILATVGSKYLILVETKDEANMEADISEINFISNIEEEAKEIILAAKKVTSYERKRKRIVRNARKELLATSRKIKN